jgi:3-phosphoshikimate 1-carboxyvinyltransferase
MTGLGPSPARGATADGATADGGGEARPGHGGAPTARTGAGEPAVVRAAARLRGEIRPPGDKSISHRALLLALLSEGESRVLGAGDGDDVRASADVVARLGAEVRRHPDGAGGIDYTISSPGLAAIREPDGVLECRNSGTTLRLTAGILAGRPMFAVLDGDASLRRRPVRRVVEPLRRMGAILRARRDDTLPPLAVAGRVPLDPIDYETPVPSAQVKSAVLLAGLQAAGTTVVRETVATRDHTEVMLRTRGVDVRTAPTAWATDDGSMVEGWRIEVDGGSPVLPADERVPGDISGAAFWLVAGASHPDAELTILGVGTNPTRRAIIDILRRMGAEIDEVPVAVPGDRPGEPISDLIVRSSELRGIDVTPFDVASAIDEIPVLCLAAALAAGRTRIRGAGELRHKESDRIAGIAAGLSALGARVMIEGDDIEIDGGRALTGAATDSRDDHRLAMTFAIAGLIARGETTVGQPGSASISYPGFFETIERVRA